METLAPTIHKKIPLPGFIPGKAYIEVIFKDGRLSICGTIDEGKNGYSGGQNYEEIAARFPDDPKIQRIGEVWKRWHLNDMRAECEHQRGPKWDALRAQVVLSYRLLLNLDMIKKQNAIKKNAEQHLFAGRVFGFSAEDLSCIKMPYELQLSIKENEAPPEAPENYQFAKIYSCPNPERRTLGWLTQEEHPEGQLSRPCEVCGRPYGSSYLREEIPQAIIEEIISW